MLLRATSTPFRYTTAPSSRSSASWSCGIDAGSFTVKLLRKYVVMKLPDVQVGALGPQWISVASSPSP